MTALRWRCGGRRPRAASSARRGSPLKGVSGPSRPGKSVGGCRPLPAPGPVPVLGPSARRRGGSGAWNAALHPALPPASAGASGPHLASIRKTAAGGRVGVSRGASSGGEAFWEHLLPGPSSPTAHRSGHCPPSGLCPVPPAPQAISTGRDWGAPPATVSSGLGPWQPELGAGDAWAAPSCSRPQLCFLVAFMTDYCVPGPWHAQPPSTLLSILSSQPIGHFCPQGHNSSRQRQVRSI